MKSREVFFQRVAGSLIIPITFLPLAAIMLAIGDQLGIGFLHAAGMALIRMWLPLFFAIGISVGFTQADGMAALSVASGFLVMLSVAEGVSQDPSFNPGVLGGIVAGGICTWLYNRVKGVELPEYLALFSGKRLGPQVSALAGVALGLLFGWLWPPLQQAVVGVGQWVYATGGAGALVYGSILRVLLPTGLHHLLMQVMDYQIGGWIDPSSGKLVAGEYLRFLAGDPNAGRILSGFFLSPPFAMAGAAMAIAHEARSEQRRRVAGLMTTGAITALLLGVTEPVEFAFIFASPVLYGLHIVLSGLASWLAWTLDIHLGGYAVPMILINWHRSQNGLLLIPLAAGYLALYYFSFRAVIRWLRPPILGQADAPELALASAGAAAAAPGEARAAGARPSGDAQGSDYLAALGGPANVSRVEACMTRLRLEVEDLAALDEARLLALGATRVLRPGGRAVQVVVGPRAGQIADAIQGAIDREPAPAVPASPARPEPAEGGAVVTILSPLSGRVIPLEEVPDPVFAGRMAGDGVAIDPADARLLSPVSGEVVHIFPGGHALGMVTPEGLEVLMHIGIDTVSLKGEGFRVRVGEGATVECGADLVQFDPHILKERGRSLVTPVLVTNPDVIRSVEVLASGSVAAGAPLLRITMK